jgi:NADP-dependent 3-hydroxy acid dehydrogenase YdfG
MMKNESLVVIITGSSSGIGHAIAIEMLNEGHQVVISSRSYDKLKLSIKKIPENIRKNILICEADVSKEQDIINLFQVTIDTFQKIDVVIINAGVLFSDLVEDMSLEKFRQIYEVNIQGVFLTVRESISPLKETSGRMILINSANALSPTPGLSVYAASKSWARQFLLSLQGELYQYGIRMTVVNLSRVDTSLGRSERLNKTTGTLLSPIDIAKTVCKIVSLDIDAVIQEVNVFRQDKWKL